MEFADIVILGWSGAVLVGILGVCLIFAAIVLLIIGALLDD